MDGSTESLNILTKLGCQTSVKGREKDPLYEIDPFHGLD